MCLFGSWELKDAQRSVVSPAFAEEGGLCSPGDNIKPNGWSANNEGEK